MGAKGKISAMRRLQMKLRYWFRGGAFTLLAFGYLGYRYFTSEEWKQLMVSDSHRALGGDDGCPSPANPKGVAAALVIGVLYMFIGLAIVADDFFVPTLEVIADWWNLSPDVAGATLMAAGGSSPELFTNLAGTFLRSDVGFGAIVGSAVFNVLFVVGFCTLSVEKPMQLDWYCICRDSTYYAFVLIILAIFFGIITPSVIDWWEALILHGLYYVYVYIMRRNDDVRIWANRNFGRGCCKSGGGAASNPALLEKSRSIEAVGGGNGGAGEEPVEMKRRLSAPKISFTKIMTSHINVMDIASTRMELAVTGNVHKAFTKYDADGSGAIDAAELRVLCVDLGCKDITDAEVQEVLKKVDANGNGTIDLEEFTNWFLGSSQRLRAEVQNTFGMYDDDKDGYLTREQTREFITNLGPHLNDEAVERAVTACIAQGAGGESGTKQVTLASFMAWYETSDLWKHNIEVGESMAEDAEGLSLAPPEAGAGAFAWFWYLLTLPYVFTFIFTLPDVRRPGNQKYAYLTFFLCLCYMGLFSYWMVTWTETIGATAQIPSVIMGLTFLAAGTSVPDMLSAVIVAKQGEGDQAVSSSIGSNVFDICIGLAFPWLLFNAVFQEAVSVSAGNLFISILVLVLTLCILIGLVKYRNWSLPYSSGWWLIFFYVCFVAQQLALTDWKGNQC